MKTIQVLKVVVLAMFILFTISCKKNKDSPVPPTACNLGAGNHPNRNNYQRIIDNFMNAGAAGVSVTVISPEGTWSACGGKANIEDNIDLTPCHTLRIGSITKVFTAATILKLQEEGVLNIKDKINKYIPGSITDHIANANDVTIEQCLNHTSGIRDYLDQNVISGILNKQIIKYSAEENLKFIYDKSAYFSPGKGMIYSNANYLLLSTVIKYATGKNAFDVVTEKIIRPLQLQNTSASTELPGTLTRCYHDVDNNGIMKDFTYADNNAVGGVGALDGGIISNSYDVAKFMEALLTGKVISPASLAQMETFTDIDPSNLPDDLKYYKQYGLGLMKIETDQGTAIGHDGHVYGFIGKVFYLPVQKVTVAILLNGCSSKTTAVLNDKGMFNNLF
ncbi:alkaline D-peptidase [Chitinophaga niastensis]|uniref:Alkaline D-peptidase n=1 Tax=Chitinophaga niastensis TaxID=536980 RepID=A0A2P8HHB1_CHINA|nr:serine hydrolase domain-containing protein [Chitinophaga niastensis]PSL45586.1 alkaline D-peptidase [Chitinophaga niastensis]